MDRFCSPAGGEPFDFEHYQSGEVMDAKIKKIWLMKGAEQGGVQGFSSEKLLGKMEANCTWK